MSYITEIQVRTSKNSPGNDWAVVEDVNGEAMDFNKGAGGDFIYIYYRLSDRGKGVSNIKFITGKDNNPGPDWIKCATDLNKGAGGLFIYICYQTKLHAPFMRKLKAGYGESATSALGDLGGYDVIPMDLNKDAGGKFIYLGYQQS